MHELSLCEGIVELLREQAAARDYRRVRTVWLEVGRLSHAEPSALRFCFDVVAKGTLAEGAALHIDEIDGEAWCEACRRVVPANTRYDPCPRCGGHRLEVVAGAELRVRELEVE